MSPALVSSLLPLLRLLDPETAHRLSLRVLRAGLVRPAGAEDARELRVAALGKTFTNPIGLAAGFDKDAAAGPALGRVGFGFVELGTVTPRPQPGNPRPRVFRLARQRAIINALGFNNAGVERLSARLPFLRDSIPVLGINVGPNKVGAVPELDYPALVSAVSPWADYVAINISSPNTPGLRDLQAPDRLASILSAIRAECPAAPPLLVKIAPDLGDDDQARVVETCVQGGAAGLIVGNTTLSRPEGVQTRRGGGLSGRPLFTLSTRKLALASVQARGRLLLVGVGGISSGMDAMTKLLAGATLVQLYTALAYEGPALIGRIKADLTALLRRDGLTVADIIGRDASRLAG